MSHNYVSIPRYLQYLNKRRIVYRRNPITDKPTLEFEYGKFYENGTYECYDLFRSKAKITTYTGWIQLNKEAVVAEKYVKVFTK